MLKKLSKIILSVFIAALLAAAVSLSAGAASIPDYPDYPGDSDFYPEQPTQRPWDAEPTQPEPYFTEPVYTEPVTEAPEPVWTVAPEEYYEEETESPREEYAQLLDEAEEPTGLNSVKMDKSVSNKTYSTDNIAGIVSWICVAVGLVVMAVMLLSTKLSGRRGV